MPAPTLDGRLLCASGCAYGITGNGKFTVDPTDVYYPGAGFLAPPTTFVGGDQLIDACLVGKTVDGVVVAFRGTMELNLDSAPTVLDWLDDFNADPITAPGYPGQVHRGFSESLGFLWDRLLAEVKRQRVGSLAAQPVYVTGHSKGGAMASLAAWKLKHGNQIQTQVVTIASARTGDIAFANAYEARISQTRYEYADDIVPHLPPEDGGFLDSLSALPVIGENFKGLKRFNYEPVGMLRYIDANGRFVEVTPLLPLERTVSLVLQIIRLHFHQIAADHSITCGSGYLTAICPAGVCKQSLASLAEALQARAMLKPATLSPAPKP
jgi:Lipase (class 3)